MARKNFLSVEQRQMSSAAYVEEAAGWAHKLALSESSGPGDYDNAMRRIGDDLNVRYSTLWGLRYRRPKSLCVTVYFALKSAVGDMTNEASLGNKYDELTSSIESLKSALLQIKERDRVGPPDDR